MAVMVPHDAEELAMGAERRAAPRHQQVSHTAAAVMTIATVLAVTALDPLKLNKKNGLQAHSRPRSEVEAIHFTVETPGLEAASGAPTSSPPERLPSAQWWHAWLQG
eukprot:2298434-Pyramimonas_sp.AAC.1